MSVDSNRRRTSALLFCVATITLVVVFWGAISRWWIDRAFALGDLRRFEEVVANGKTTSSPTQSISSMTSMISNEVAGTMSRCVPCELTSSSVSTSLSCRTDKTYAKSPSLSF